MLELNTATFKETIDGDMPVVVDFWAEWCMPCKMLAPVLEEISDELDGKAQFCKVNIDDNNDLAREYDVSMIPTVIIFKNGNAVERMVGVMPKRDILEKIVSNI